MSLDMETMLVDMMADAIAREIDQEIMNDLLERPEHDFVSVDPDLLAPESGRVVSGILAHLRRCAG